ncbi:MAG: VOC family protein [Verrucomicrobiaceae bacterium]|nr:VOC family protein [Verrucomicrobiaceae bacterium]
MNYPALTPYLCVHDGLAAIKFYEAAFGAKERYRLTAPGNKIGHCEMTVEGQVFMLGDEMPPYNKCPQTLGGIATKFALMVPNADVACERAMAAGAVCIMPPTDMFYGFRNAHVRDPFGHEWMLQHEVEKVSPKEMQRRFDAMVSGCPSDKT